MVNRRGLVMAAVGSITAVMVFGAGGGVASATPTAPSVVTLDSSNNVYLSQGSTPTLLRPGRKDVYPFQASLDGTSSLWDVGTDFDQTLLVHNGAVEDSWNNITAGLVVGTFTQDGTLAAVAMGDPNTAGSLIVREITVGTNAITTFHISGGADNLQDLEILSDGHILILEAGSPAKLIQCWGPGNNVQTTALPTLPDPSTSSHYVAWGATVNYVAGDGPTVIDLANYSHSPTTDEGYVISNPETTPTVTDAGALPANTTGQFIGSTLYLAESGELLSYNTVPGTFPATPTTTTSTPMTGNPDVILNTGATLDTTFTTPTPFGTGSELLWWAGSQWNSTGSGTVYLGRSLQLAPASYPASAGEQALWDDFEYWDPRSAYLLYSYDHVHWYDYNWSNSNFAITRSVWLRAYHTADINSLSSISGITEYTAKPYLVVHYTAAAWHLYGTANVPNGTLIQVQRRLSATGAWTVYYAKVPVQSTNWSVTLPHEVAQWRVVVPATSSYIAAISATVKS